MFVHYFLFMMLVSNTAMAQNSKQIDDDDDVVDNTLGRAAAIPPHLPPSQHPVPRGQHSKIGGGQGHQHGGSSNKEV